MTITPDEITVLRELSKKTTAPITVCVQFVDDQIMCVVAKDGEHGVGVDARERRAKRQASQHLDKRQLHER